jgi:hypothetical protein
MGKTFTRRRPPAEVSILSLDEKGQCLAATLLSVAIFPFSGKHELLEQNASGINSERHPYPSKLH